MKRLVTAGAAAIALVGVVGAGRPVGAQAPVRSGSSFGTAPLVGPGRSTDTIVQLEELYVAVDLGDGQLVRARATLTGQPDGPADSNSIAEVIVYSPNRLRTSASEAFFDGRSDVTVSRESYAVGDSRSPEPGRYFVSVKLRDVGQQVLAGRAYDYTLAVEVVQERPTTTTTSDPSSTTTTVAPPAGPTRSQAGSDGSEGRDAPVAYGVASFVLGVAGGGVAARIRRRPS